MDSSEMVAFIRQAIPEITAIYTYGSRVRGGVHPGSDLDLALLLPSGCRIAAETLAQLEGDLESLAGFPVEISILSPETQVVHSKEVVAGGRVLFSLDPRIVDEFEMRVLSSYARLCEDRAPVLEAYAKRNAG